MESDRFLVAGLGNPGRNYRRNRHNAGFLLVDRLASSLDLQFTRHRFEAVLTDGALDGRRLILAKPQTFMNRVGRSVAAMVRFHRLPLDHVLVVYDDLDIPVGSLRLRGSGGSAGHKGLTSVIESLGTQDVPRLRLGISRPPGSMDPADYVLRDFDDFEWGILEAGLDRGVDCVRTWILEGLSAAMTRFNPFPE
jgi:peptidyl-tRNA hydrolase, PTH1 family